MPRSPTWRATSRSSSSERGHCSTETVLPAGGSRRAGCGSLLYPGVAQLVGRQLWELEAARSNRATRTSVVADFVSFATTISFLMKLSPLTRSIAPPPKIGPAALGSDFVIRQYRNTRYRPHNSVLGDQVILLHWFDNDFFEAYKKLDRLCSDLYTEKNGISAYIADMESKTAMGRYLVPSWDSDYKSLKHVRWVRNQIAHESDVLQLSETSDLSFVQDFYDRILSEADPLTLFRKAEESQKRTRVYRLPQSQPSQSSYHSQPATEPPPAPQHSQPPAQPPRKDRILSPLLAFLVMVLLVIVFFVLRLKLDR